jgi:hypothetical protein
VGAGGDDLPGFNPSLYAGQTFASVEGNDAGAIVLTPDACLVQFGESAVLIPCIDPGCIPAQIVSMPMMNLTRNDWQFCQGKECRWVFSYRLLLSSRMGDRLAPLSEVQRFGVPPWLQLNGRGAALPCMDALEIDFAGGPMLALKEAEDGERVVLRLWDAPDRPVEGSLRLPGGFAGGEQCDGLERPRVSLRVRKGRPRFVTPARDVLTLALCRHRESVCPCG